MLHQVPFASLGVDPSTESATSHLATITAFFDAYGECLPRAWLSDLLKAAISSEQSGWNGERRVDYMQFCERLAGLLDACYLLIH
jgi:hypothetical protein